MGSLHTLIPENNDFYTTWEFHLHSLGFSFFMNKLNDYMRGPMHTPVPFRGPAYDALAQTMVRIQTTQIVTRNMGNMGHEQLTGHGGLRTGGNSQLLFLITY